MIMFLSILLLPSSPLMRGEWIEMSQEIEAQQKKMSPLMRGEWIEIR